jgi:ribosomal protein S18 acetylase RimI-like enzyme
MSNPRPSGLRIQSLEDRDLPSVRHLFCQYSYKDYQLSQLEIPKEKMVDLFTGGLSDEHAKNFCLWEEEEVVGFVSLKTQPWLSEYFEAKMCSIQHLLGLGSKQDHYESMVKYVLDHIEGIDCWACRVASSDIFAIHALENTGFRFVGSEAYLVKSLKDASLSEDYFLTGCEPCEKERLPEVLDIVDNNHFHNRYMYDPNIAPHKAIGIYKDFLSSCAFEKDFRLLVKRSGQEIHGFILYKFNAGLSEMTGRRYASLDFIGVSAGKKNAGIGVALNKAAVVDLVRAGVSHLVVRTLASNYPAIRICNKIGFKLTSTDLHFHYWVRPRVRSEE